VKIFCCLVRGGRQWVFSADLAAPRQLRSFSFPEFFSREGWTTNSLRRRGSLRARLAFDRAGEIDRSCGLMSDHFRNYKQHPMALWASPQELKVAPRKNHNETFYLGIWTLNFSEKWTIKEIFEYRKLCFYCNLLFDIRTVDIWHFGNFDIWRFKSFSTRNGKASGDYQKFSAKCFRGLRLKTIMRLLFWN
jgi:hypothetical protein